MYKIIILDHQNQRYMWSKCFTQVIKSFNIASERIVWWKTNGMNKNLILNVCPKIILPHGMLEKKQQIFICNQGEP